MSDDDLWRPKEPSTDTCSPMRLKRFCSARTSLPFMPRRTGRRLPRACGRGPERVLRGLVAVGRGIPRPGMSVTLTQDVPLCDITSGTFSPTLKKGIGLALVPTMVAPDAQVGVDIRGRREIFQLVDPPFVDPSVRES